MAQTPNLPAVQPDSRTRLLDAAAEVFAERGYTAASVDEIAARAGLSKGAVYWNFKSKDELFLALLDERVYAPLRAINDYTINAPPEASAAEHAGQVIGELISTQRELVLLDHEHWLIAVRDDELRSRYAELLTEMRDGLAAALKARHDHLGAPPFDLSPEEVATAYIALAHGLAIPKLTAPELVPDHLYGEIASLIYEGLVARALGTVPPEQQHP